MMCLCHCLWGTWSGSRGSRGGGGGGCCCSGRGGRGGGGGSGGGGGGGRVGICLQRALTLKQRHLQQR